MHSTKEILNNARVIAVVGCSDNPGRVSHRIARYLQQVGYKVYPVNPLVSEAIGEKAYPDVKSIPEKVDIVNVFRSSRHVPGIVDDAIAAGAKAIWLQLDITDPEAERRAEAAGLDVVTDICIMVEHQMQGIAMKTGS